MLISPKPGMGTDVPFFIISFKNCTSTHTVGEAPLLAGKLTQNYIL